MYKQVTTDKVATMANGKTFSPVATLADSHGGDRCQIALENHSYVIRLLSGDGTYRNTDQIFREVFEVLKTLPSPR